MKKSIRLLIVGLMLLCQISCKEDDNPGPKCSFKFDGATYSLDHADCYGEDGFVIIETYYLYVQEPGTISFHPDASTGIYGDWYSTDSGTITRNGKKFSFKGNLKKMNANGPIEGSGYISGDCSCEEL